MTHDATDDVTLPADIDPARFATHVASPRGFDQAYVHEGIGGVPLVCVHGWPETKRIFWKVIEPLAAAGFEVIVPDLRGFGDSGLGPDGFHDVPSYAHDLHALVHDVLGHERVVLLGGDLGGPVIQDLALRHPDWVDRMVLFNSPLPYDKERMAGLTGTRAPREASDYFVRQGTDPDGLVAELRTPEAAPTLHRHVLHEPLLGPPRCVHRARFRCWSLRRERSGRLPHRTVRRRRSHAGQLRRLREHLRPRRPLRGVPVATQRADAHAPAVRPERSCPVPRLRPDGRRSCSPIMSARSCSATAATSSRGRRRTPWCRARQPCAATCSAPRKRHDVKT